MKLSKIIPTGIQRRINNYRHNTEQSRINELVSIDYSLNKSAASQLSGAQDVLANYATSKGISIDISSARKFFTNFVDYKGQTEDGNKLVVTVTDLLHGTKRHKILSDNTKGTYNYIYNNPNDPIRKYFYIIDDPEEGLQRSVKTKHVYEDNFLRNIYRNIEAMVKEIQHK